MRSPSVDNDISEVSQAADLLFFKICFRMLPPSKFELINENRIGFVTLKMGFFTYIVVGLGIGKGEYGIFGFYIKYNLIMNSEEIYMFINNLYLIFTS